MDIKDEASLHRTFKNKEQQNGAHAVQFLDHANILYTSPLEKFERFLTLEIRTAIWGSCSFRAIPL
jgi:hypothetical protein